MEEIKYSEEIEKVINEANTGCPLYATEECALLNMEACGECPVGSMKPDKQAKAKAALGRLLASADPSEIEKLYTSEECLFCSGNHPNSADCWAMLDLRKPDPEGDWTIALGRKKLAVKGADMILPLQVSCCRKCREKYRLFDYLPTAAAIFIAALGLLLVSCDPVYKALFAVRNWLPFVVMAVCAALAFGVWFALKFVLSRSLARHMHIDASELPVIGRLIKEGGFTEVNEKKFGVSRLVFAPERRKTGVYTRVTELPEDGEKPGSEPEKDPEGKIGPEPDERPQVCGIWPAEMPPEEPEDAGEEEAPSEDGE